MEEVVLRGSIESVTLKKVYGYPLGFVSAEGLTMTVAVYMLELAIVLEEDPPVGLVGKAVTPVLMTTELAVS